MAQPLGKRELIAWTICGALAVGLGVVYSKRSREPAPVTPVTPTTLPVTSPLTTPVVFDSSRPPKEKTVFVKGESTVKMVPVQPAPRPRGEMSSPLPKREPRDTAWIRIGSRPPNAQLRVNDVLRGPADRLAWWHVPAGEVKLWINAPDCRAWDTTMTIRRGDSVTIGIRVPRC